MASPQTNNILQEHLTKETFEDSIAGAIVAAVQAGDIEGAAQLSQILIAKCSHTLSKDIEDIRIQLSNMQYRR